MGSREKPLLWLFQSSLQHHPMSKEDLAQPAFSQTRRGHLTSTVSRRGTDKLCFLTSTNMFAHFPTDFPCSWSSHSEDTPRCCVNQPYKRWRSCGTHRAQGSQGRGERKPFCSVKEPSVHIPSDRQFKVDLGLTLSCAVASELRDQTRRLPHRQPLELLFRESVGQIGSYSPTA